MYRSLYKKMDQKVSFSSSFIDEADTIGKTVSTNTFGHFTILVSSNREEMFKQFEVPSEFVVDCEKDFIIKSVNYCELNEITLNCAMSNIVNSYVPEEAHRFLVIDDYEFLQSYERGI